MATKNEKPIRVFWSELSQRFYAASRYRIDKDGTVHFTGPKTDVTDDIADALINYEIEFSRIGYVSGKGPANNDDE